MKTLTLNLKRIYFDQILSGEKTHEYRDFFPENVKTFVYYTIGDKEFAGDAELPSEEECQGEVIPHPVKYDYIKFLTGAYSGKRPYMVVEVKDAQINFIKDENGEQIVVLDEATGIEFVAAQLDYTLGKIIDKFDC